MPYGVDTAGASDPLQLEQRRAAAAASQAPAAGKDLDVTLMFADGGKTGSDPAFLVHEGPIFGILACLEHDISCAQF